MGQDARIRTDLLANPHHSSPAAPFFSAPDRPVEPRSCAFRQFQRHAHDGGARNRRLAVRLARTIGPVTAASASWKVMARA